MFRYNDDDGNRIADDPDSIARILSRIRTKEAGELQFRSDIGGYVSVRRPVAEGEDVVFLRVETATGSYRNETWDLDKFESYLEAGFIVDAAGSAFRQWTRPYPVVELPSTAVPKANPLQVKIVAARALELVHRLDLAGDVSGRNAVLDLLAVSRAVPEEDMQAMREAVWSEECADRLKL